MQLIKDIGTSLLARLEVMLERERERERADLRQPLLGKVGALQSLQSLQSLQYPSSLSLLKWPRRAFFRWRRGGGTYDETSADVRPTHAPRS